MESTTARKNETAAWNGRVEDDPLLRGAGKFGDDIKPAGAFAAYFVRSPHGFAEIRHIDTTAAKNTPGVVAVYMSEDLAAAHYHSISHPHPIPGRGGKSAVSPHRPSLAEKRVMHVGEPVAMVVATSTAAAQDAAEKIAVDYQPLKAVTDVREAIAPGASQLWPEAPGNVGFDWTAPADPDGKKNAALEKAFREAALVVRLELVNQRLVVASLEPRTANASYDGAANQYTLRCGTQAVAAVRGQVASAMGIKPEELRVFLEEAAGVSKYRDRRRETESRLADARDNLARIDDIRRELGSQLEKLEAQAKVVGPDERDVGAGKRAVRHPQADQERRSLQRRGSRCIVYLLHAL